MLKNELSSRNRGILFLLMGALTLIGPLLFIGNGPLDDWTYFDALSNYTKNLFLRFNTISFHDPWRCGGINVLANPQNRAFSPFVLFDLFLSPHWANTLSYGIEAALGAWGMFSLLRFLGARELASLIGAMSFVFSSYFGFHLLEGHIIWGSFQLLPWLLLAWLRFGERPWRLFYFGLMAFFLLNGAFYTFIFSIYLTLSCAVLFWRPASDQLKASLKDPLYSSLCVLVFGLLSAPKLVPVLIEMTGREASLEFFRMPLKSVLISFFSPIQRKKFSSGIPTGYHEVSCYFGLFQLGLVLWATRKNNFLKKNWAWMAMALFWIWVGTGWLEPFNPWTLIKKIPVLNNARIQSRTFILALLPFLILFVRAFDQLDHRKIWVKVAIGYLVMEALLLRNWPFEAWKGRPGTNWDTYASEQWVTLEKTLQYEAAIPNTGSQVCMEPSIPFKTKVLYAGHPRYKGEATTNHATVEAQILTFNPNGLEVMLKRKNPLSPWPTDLQLRVNTNDLGYWRTTTGNARPPSSRGEVLKVAVAPSFSNESNLKVGLVHRPPYLIPVIASYLLGLMALLAMTILTRRSKRLEPSR